MLEIAYTKRRISKCINYADIINDKTLLDTKNRDAKSKLSAEKIATRTIFKEDLKLLKIKGKTAYTFANTEQALVTRLISKNIKANYKIRPQNRNLIIRSLISTLRESSPYNIHRFDIENFFESIDRPAIFNKLISEDNCSRQTLTLIYDLFERIKSQGILGLPRGIGLSSTLSELALHDFDAAIKRERNVFYYARFVDDMILITAPDFSHGDVIKLLEGNLGFGLKLHKSGNKISHHSLGKASDKNQTKPKNLQYLGYDFSIHEKNSRTDSILGIPRRHIEIEICKDKIDRIKSRIIASFTNYLSNATAPTAFHILESRIKALTGNYSINDPLTKINIKTGIFYNYPEKNKKINCPLKELDAMLRGLLFDKKPKLSSRIQKKLTLNQRRQLIGHTFTKGFYEIRLHTFTHEDLKKIKEVWKK
ncbi:antiviral reverse transcriptase Drt3a [Burkholderia sp. A2]|uniref:antiviral reverse transcriptase Drt3a n=1 Tax=Burkholderia sp. A2 TaxID=236253 RepID=UPI0009FD3FB6|nr:antiviral reverse transcriptase Drt3a [Burkholderia sp. A2]